jgi:cytochrome c-type biogenesis protein
MKLGRMLTVVVLVAGLFGSYLSAEEKPVAPAPGSKAALVSDTHPGLASGCLTYARLSDLPKGTILKAGDLILTEKDVADEIAKAPQEVQAQLKKNGFFMLEQIAGPRLIVQIAKAEAARTGKELPSQVDRLVMDYHLGGLAEKVEATDAEVADFYQKNKEMVGNATLDQVKAEVRSYLVREKQQAVTARYIETLGQRTPIEVSAAWVKEQAALAKDNLVDKARVDGAHPGDAEEKARGQGQHPLYPRSRGANSGGPIRRPGHSRPGVLRQGRQGSVPARRFLPAGRTREKTGRDGGEIAMEQLFTTLTHAVEGTPAIALGAAFAWGILSILLSPCHLASIPLIVGFIDEQGRISTRRAFLISTLFAVGILITIGAIGAITAAAGRMLGDVGRWGNYFVAAIFFVVGLHLVGVIPMPWSGPGQVGMKRKGMLAAFILGLVFGIAIGPCTFAYMAPMLGVTFKLAATNIGYGILLLATYGVGHCSVIVVAGTSTELVQRYLNWNEQSKGAVILKKVCGVLVLLAGVYLIYIAK